MLPHEQFRLPELLAIGADVEKAGFDLLAKRTLRAAIHSPL
jgi:hypothetical protein